MDKKVEIYTTPTCTYCKASKLFFNENGIKYSEYDVTQDPARRKEMMDKSQQMGVPVIVIDGQMIIGFQKDKLSSLLGINS